MAELNAEPEETELDSDSDEHIVELSKLDQSQATLLQSIIQSKSLQTIQHKIKQDE